MYNAVTGETITYQYDSLNRLASAAGNGWGDTYGFDGFGNLLTKTPTAGPAPTLSQAVNPANNQIVGQSYHANGNLTNSPNGLSQLGYDAENRLIENYSTAQYAYDSQNKRVWAGTLVSNTLTGQSASLYGIDGQKLGTYSLSVTSTQFTVTAASLSVYFAGKRVAIIAGGGNTPFVQDRLGSNMNGAAVPVSLYPWGEDRGTPAPNDQIKFATYTRDSSTLLDYADQRYYSNAYGRFMTPDSAPRPRLADPQSWNMYAYTGGDPVNRNDPQGTDWNDCGAGWVSDASLSGPCVADPYGGYIDLSGIIQNAVQQAYQYAGQVVGSELTDLENSGAINGYGSINFPAGTVSGLTLPIWALGYVEEASAAAAAGVILGGPVVTGVVTIGVTVGLVYEIWQLLHNNPAVPAPWKGFTQIEEELTKPGSTWRWNGSKFEQDCPPGSPKQIQTLHWNPPDQYHQFGHYDYVDCNGHSWSVWGDGTMTPNK